MFFPCGDSGEQVCDAAEHCSCHRDHNTPGSMICEGAAFGAAMVAKHVTGKHWTVFVHGGEFAWNNNIGVRQDTLSPPPPPPPPPSCAAPVVCAHHAQCAGT
jgi:hypothetical protein